jgi:hypothetical protein
MYIKFYHLSLCIYFNINLIKLVIDKKIPIYILTKRFLTFLLPVEYKMRNKFLLLTTTSLISTFLTGMSESHASLAAILQAQANKKQELITKYKAGTLTRQQVEQQAARFKIPDIAQDLFPPHWEQFFTYFNALTYPQLLTACDQLSQGTLAQSFAGPVQANLAGTGNRGVRTLRDWLAAARDEVMAGPLQGFAERRQQLDHYIAAAEISECLGHTINADEQARIFAAIKTGQPLDAALQQSLGNIQYKGHNITPLVATEILNNRRARPQAETEAKVTQEIALLLNANLGLNDDICTRVANDVIRNNRNPVDALTTILNYVVEGHDITRAVANKVITGSTPLDTALRQTRIEKYTELLRAKNYALTNAQYNDIAVALQHGQPTPAAFQSVLNVDACEGQEIKNTVIAKMIADNIAFADAIRQVSITTRFNRLKTQNLGLSDAVLQNVATAVTTENRGYVQAFKSSLPNMPFRFLDANVDLKDSVAAALVQGRPLEAATIQARINVVKTQLGAPNNGLTPKERDDIAAKIVTEGSSIGDAFKSALSERPEFRHVQDAELTNAVNRIVDGSTVTNAWEMACLRPQSDALRDHFRLIDDAIIQQMARHKLAHGSDDRTALLAALEEQRDLPLTYCRDRSIIAKHMMQEGSASLNRALILANQEFVEQRLIGEGWDFFGARIGEVVDACLNAPNLKEGVQNYLFSFGVKEEWLNDFATYLKANRTLPADAKALFLQRKTEERLRTQYACINNDGIIQYLARKLVQADTIDADITENNLKEAFTRTDFTIAPEVFDDAVRALLSRQATSIEGAIIYGNTCIKAREIKRDYAHLPEEECLSLANHLVGHPARIIKVALTRELAKRQITDRNEVAEIIGLVLEENQTIAQAESHFGYRALMRQYLDQFTEEQARLIAQVMRDTRSSDNVAIRHYLLNNANLLSRDAADVAYLYFQDNREKLSDAITKSRTVTPFIQELRNIPNLGLSEENIFAIASQAYDYQGGEGDGNLTAGNKYRSLGNFLSRRGNLNIPAELSSVNIINNNLHTILAKEILNKRLSIAAAIQKMARDMDNYLVDVSSAGARILSNRPHPYNYNQNGVIYGIWEDLLGDELFVAASEITAFMLYIAKVDVNNISARATLDINALKPVFTQALATYLQLHHPYLLTDNYVSEEIPAEACFMTLAKSMVTNRLSMQAALNQITGAIGNERAELERRFPYLRRTEQLQDWLQSRFWAGANDLERADLLKTFLNDKVRQEPYASEMTLWAKRPADLDEEERKDYLAKLTAKFLTLEGKNFSGACNEFKKQMNEITEKYQKMLIGLPNHYAHTLAWDTTISELEPARVLARIIRENSDNFGIPAILRHIQPQFAEALANRIMTKFGAEHGATIEEFISAHLKGKIVRDLYSGGDGLKLPKFMLEQIANRLIAQTPHLTAGNWNNKKIEVLARFLAEKSAEYTLSITKRDHAQAVAKKMLEDNVSLFEASLYSNVSDLDKETAYTVLLALLGFQVDNSIIDKGLALRGKVKEKLTAQADWITVMEDEKPTRLEVLLASYHHARQHLNYGVDQEPNVETLKSGQAIARRLVAEHYLTIRGNINPEAFSITDFNPSAEQNIKIIANLLKDQGVQLLELSDTDIAKYYRAAYHLLPKFAQEEQTRKNQDLQRNITAKKIAFDIFRATRTLNVQDSYPYHRRFIDAIIEETNARLRINHAGQEVRLNLNNLRYEPWFKPIPVHELVPQEISIVEYNGLRNRILGQIQLTTTLSNEEKNNYRNMINRFFSWGNGGEHLREHDDPLQGGEASLWRKRVKLVCDRVILKNNPSPADVASNVATIMLHANECINASKQVLQELEKRLELQQPTLRNRIAATLNNWKIQKLNELGREAAQGRTHVEIEFQAFLKLAFKHTLSVNALEDAMSYSGTTSYHVGEPPMLFDPPREDRTNVRLVTRQFLDEYRANIVDIVSRAITTAAEPDPTQIAFQEVVEWAEKHPAYCNTLELETELLEREDDGSFKAKPTVVKHLLKDAGYIDWDERD